VIYSFVKAVVGVAVLSASINFEAETIGRLNQKFFGRRVVTVFSSPLPQSRVFSKNLLRQLPDGTTQASGWYVTHTAMTLQIS
jgi:hypothetical protein